MIVASIASIRVLSLSRRPADVAEDVTLHAFKTGYRHVGMLGVTDPVVVT